MTFSGEVFSVETTGESLRIKVGNIRRKRQAFCVPYHPSISIEIPFGAQRSYPVGRVVDFTLTPK